VPKRTLPRAVKPKATLAKKESQPQSIEEFVLQAKELGQYILREYTYPIVAHHYDADGITSGSIVSIALSRAHIKHTLSMFKKLDSQAVEHLRTTALSGPAPRPVILVDFGSGQLSLVAKGLVDAGIKVAVIDHHAPTPLAEPLDAKLFRQVNCALQGLDGASVASAATTAFFCFRDQPWQDPSGAQRDSYDLAVLGIVGAVGDMQDLGPGFRGPNKLMLDSAVQRGFAVCTTGLRFFGRVSRTLVQFIAYAQEPAIPGIFGDERAAARFLSERQIPYQQPVTQSISSTEEYKWLKYSDLSGEQKTRLASELIAYCLANGMDEESAKALTGPVYEFPLQPSGTELSDANEFATLLNSCGRNDRQDLGFAVCRGEDPKALDAARAVLEMHRQQVSQGIQYAAGHTSDFGAFYFLDGRSQVSDSIIGTVIGAFFASGILAPIKPIIGFSLDEDKTVKVSSRANKLLVESGLDLNVVMRLSAAAAGGQGGGHNIAAGASIPQGTEDKFLRQAKAVVETQLPSLFSKAKEPAT
jgi:RecJ-like exonuclease